MKTMTKSDQCERARLTEDSFSTAPPGDLCETDDVVDDRLRIMTVDTRKLEWLMVNQDESAVLGRQQRLESSLVEGCCIHLGSSHSLVLWFLSRNSFGDAEGHLDPARAIVNIRFHVAVRAERDCSGAKLDSWAKADRTLL